MSTGPPNRDQLLRKKAITAGTLAGFSAAAFAVQYPLDVVQTRLQVHDGRLFSQFPKYNNTVHAIFTVTRSEGLKGLYAGFLPCALGSTISAGLLFFIYRKAKQGHARSRVEKLSPRGLASSAESGALVCLCANPFLLVKTRLQLQTPLHQARPYSGLYDAFRTIMRKEGFSALYRGIGPGLFVWVSHSTIHFTAYKELRKTYINLKKKGSKIQHQNPDKLLNFVDYAILGATSKVAAILPTYPFQVIRSRLQQRPDGDGIPRYMNSWHVVKETARFEGVRGFYKGLTLNLLRHAPVYSVSFIFYQKVLKLLKPA